MEEIRPVISRIRKARLTIPEEGLARGMKGHHQLGRNYNDGSYLPSLHGHLLGLVPTASRSGRRSDERNLTYLSEYFGLTEDELDQIITDVNALKGKEERAAAAKEALRRIEREEQTSPARTARGAKATVKKASRKRPSRSQVIRAPRSDKR